MIACQIGNAVLLLLESVFFQSFPMQQRNQHCTLYFYTIAIDAEYVSSHCGSTGGSKQCVQLATSSEKGTIDFNSIHVFFETNQTLTSNLKTCPGSRRSHLFPWEKQLRLASEICFFWGAEQRTPWPLSVMSGQERFRYFFGTFQVNKLKFHALMIW